MWQPTSKPNHFSQQPPQATANLLHTYTFWPSSQWWLCHVQYDKNIESSWDIMRKTSKRLSMNKRNLLVIPTVQQPHF